MPRARAHTSEEKAKAKTPRKPRRTSPKPKKVETEFEVQSLSAFEIPAQSTLAHGHVVHRHHQDTLNHPNMRKQRLTMILSICVIMAVIIVAWALNLRRMINDSTQAPAKNEVEQVDFAGLKKELAETLDEVKTNIGQLDQITATVTPSAEPEISPITATAPPAVTGTALPEPSSASTTITPTAQPTLPN